MLRAISVGLAGSQWPSAWAPPSSPDRVSHTRPPTAAHRTAAHKAAAHRAGSQTKTNTGTATNDTGNAEDKNSGTSETDGRHRATATTSGSVRATTIVRRLSDAADATAKRLADAVHDASEQPTASRPRRQEPTRSGGSSSPTGRATKRTSAAGTADTENASDTGNVVANEFVNKAPTVKEWLASPRAAAGRAGDTASTVTTETSLWTPPRFLTGQGPLLTMNATPATTASTTVRAPNLLATVLGDVFNPFAGNSPNTPTPETPLSWMLLGAARRQIGVDSLTSQSLLAPADSITYAPLVEMVNGVMTWDDPDAPTGFTYTLVKDPSGGGKLLLDRNYRQLQFPARFLIGTEWNLGGLQRAGG